MCLLADVSIPEVGSSKYINLESPINAMATESLLFWPPDKFLLKSSAFSYKSTSYMAFSTASGILDSSIPLNTANISKCSLTVISS